MSVYLWMQLTGGPNNRFGRCTKSVSHFFSIFWVTCKVFLLLQFLSSTFICRSYAGFFSTLFRPVCYILSLVNWVLNNFLTWVRQFESVLEVFKQISCWLEFSQSKFGPELLGRNVTNLAWNWKKETHELKRIVSFLPLTKAGCSNEEASPALGAKVTRIFYQLNN